MYTDYAPLKSPHTKVEGVAVMLAASELSTDPSEGPRSLRSKLLDLSECDVMRLASLANWLPDIRNFKREDGLDPDFRHVISAQAERGQGKHRTSDSRRPECSPLGQCLKSGG